MYMWDTDEKVDLWQKHKGKRIVWCFEPIDSHVQQWHLKSHYSINQCQKFMHDIFATDERSCDKYGVKWLPQWSSNKFYEMKNRPIETDKILFSGQAGLAEYSQRNQLLTKILQDTDLSDRISVTNTTRSLSWDEYIDNFLKYPVVLNPIGILSGCNTRTYETLISGRVLLQQEDEIGYKRHRELLLKHSNVLFFSNYDDLKKIILEADLMSLMTNETEAQYNENNLFARLDLIKEKTGA